MVEKLAAMASHLTRHFPAVHMTWGAINELSTLTGYRALIERAHHPMLTTVMSRIIKDERRHFLSPIERADAADQAARRLYLAHRAQFLDPGGKPGARRRRRAHRICEFLFPGDEGRARLTAMDEMIARLPGLEWFDLGTRYCDAPQSKTPIVSIPRIRSRVARAAISSNRGTRRGYRPRAARVLPSRQNARPSASPSSA